jgi:hypothetical protein
MPVNLTVMDVVGRPEAPIFTWNPVEQMWVQERGGAAKPPPSPHDVHAIQTWFFDPDASEWIQTVLGPMGRQLAAQWRGAYRVPETAVVRKAKTPSKRSPLPFLIAGAVLIAIISGVAVAAPDLLGSPTATPGPVASNPVAPAPTAAASTEASPTAAPTAPPTEQPVVTAAPTARPVPRPAGPSVTLGDGTTVTYTGPSAANRGGSLPASFAVVRGNGRAGTGSFAAILDNGNPSNRRIGTGTLDANGRITLNIPTNVVVGPYELSFSYLGATHAITTVTIR